MIERIAEMFFTLLQRLTDTPLLSRVFLCVYDVPAVGAIGGVDNANDRQGDNESIEADARDEHRDSTCRRRPGIVCNRGPEKMLLPDFHKRSVELHRFAHRGETRIDDVLDRRHDKKRQDEIAGVSTMPYFINRSEAKAEHRGGDKSREREQARIEEPR